MRFKVGDRVRVTAVRDLALSHRDKGDEGKIGVITEIDANWHGSLWGPITVDNEADQSGYIAKKKSFNT